MHHHPTTARLSLFLALASLTLTARPTRAATSYAITDLGTLGGATSAAYAVNRQGDVAGTAALPDGRMHAFMFKDGVMMDLGTLGGTNSFAYGINDHDQTVGSADLPGGAHHGFTATNGLAGAMMSDLGTLGGSNSVAYCINALGQITGQADFSFTNHHAFLWTNGMANMMDLDGNPASSSAGQWINSAGEVVGAFGGGPNGDRAMMMGGPGGGGMGAMGTLGGNASWANSVNGAAEVVGSSTLPGGQMHAFMATRGMMGMNLVDMGTLGGTNSQAFCINTNGAIVGTADAADGTTHAFLYHNGMMQDLTSLITAGTGWQLTEARAINDAGQIVGSGMMSGQMHAYLLTPTDTPTAVTTLPGSMIMSPRASATFAISMTSGDPLTYQWMRDGMLLPGQTNAALILTNVQPPLGGRYNVVVRNAIGMVANETATLTLLQLQRRLGAAAALMINGPMGAPYRVDFATNLSGPNPWTTLTNLALPTNSYLLMDPGSLLQPMGFYRVAPGQ